MRESKRHLSNKGSGIYYVLLIMIVISILFTALAYLSLNSAYLTSGSISEEFDYMECDSALNKVLGTLRAEFLGENYEFLTGTSATDHLFSEMALTTKYYYPIEGASYHVKAILAQPDDEEPVIKGNTMMNSQLGFEAVYDINGRTGRIVIKDITAQKQSVAVSTDIVFIVKDGKIDDIVFEHYTVKSASPDPTPTGSPEGGDEYEI